MYFNTKIMTSKFPPITDCKFGNNDEICATGPVLNSIKKLIENLSKDNNKYYRNIKSSEEIIDTAKKLTNCESESCVIASKDFINMFGKNKSNEIKREIFKPWGPKDSTWLSNVNIDEVLDQWTGIYPGYNHIPFKMNDTLKKVKMHNIVKNGMHCFSIAINTDRSSGPGIHWFCVYGDFNNDSAPKTLEYFNSSGSKPSREVHEWLHKIKHDTEKNLGDDTKIILVHKNDLQKGESECGLFVLWYIYNRLNGTPYREFFESESADDDMMFEFRKHIFRKHK